MAAGRLVRLLRQPWTSFLSASHRTVHRSPISHRALRIGIALAAVVMVCGLGARAATAASTASTKSCADQVIADWYDDGKVSKIYPLQCYRDAIKKLPPDVRQYSNAAEEIARALAFAKQGKPDPGGSPSTDTTATTETRAPRTRRPSRRRPRRRRRRTRRRRTRRRRSTRPRSTPRRRTPPGLRPCPSHCSCSGGSRCCCSRPARPATCAAG